MLDHTDPVASIIPSMSLDSPSDNAMTALSRLALGPVNTAYYLAVFERFDTTGRTTTTWNWAACLCTLNWMLFRQLWSPALVYVAAAEGLALIAFGIGRSFLHWPPGVELGVLGAFAVVAFAVPGLYGNAILYADIRKRVARALAASRTLPEASALLEKQASSRKRLQLIVLANAVLGAAAALAYMVWSPSSTQPLALEPSVTVAQATANAASGVVSSDASAAPTAPSSTEPQAPAAAATTAPPPATAAPDASGSSDGTAGSGAAETPRSAPATSAAPPTTPAPVAAAASTPSASLASSSSSPMSTTPAATAVPSTPAAATAATPSKTAPAASAPAAKAAAARATSPASSAPTASAAAPTRREAAASRPAAKSKVAKAPASAKPAASDASATASASAATSSAPLPTVGSTPGYYINVGLFADEANARKAQARLLNEGLPAFRQELNSANGRRIRVRVGPYNSRAQADKAAASIRAMSLEAVVFKQ